MDSHTNKIRPGGPSRRKSADCVVEVVTIIHPPTTAPAPRSTRLPVRLDRQMHVRVRHRRLDQLCSATQPVVARGQRARSLHPAQDQLGAGMYAEAARPPALCPQIDLRSRVTAIIP
jgi:hypothetical protein